MPEMFDFDLSKVEDEFDPSELGGQMFRTPYEPDCAGRMRQRTG